MLDGNDGNDLTPEYYSHFEVVVVHYTRFHFMTLRQDIYMIRTLYLQAKNKSRFGFLVEFYPILM